MKQTTTPERLSECTSVLVGSEMTDDGSRYLARSEDWGALIAKNIEFHHSGTFCGNRFTAIDSHFSCDLPDYAHGYTALAPFNMPGTWGSAGFNSRGVGMSATESIFSSEKALSADPMEPDRLAENSVFNIVLPYISSAREGAERLGRLITEHGVSEGFGVGFIDAHEVWYIETASGHRWLACRLPEEVYFVTGNQSRFRHYDPEDKENYLASDDLLDFAKEHGLWDPSEGDFDFHKAYIRDEELDTTYNYPRVWGLQAILNPSTKQEVTRNDFPVFAQAEKKIDLDMMRRLFRFHYNGTEHDPYLHSNPHEPYRPVSIFRTTQTHLLNVRPNIPTTIGCVDYFCFGMAALGVFLPMYQGIKSVPEAYTKGTDHSSHDSAYWKFRKVQALGMVNFNRYAPIIQKCYAELEKENDRRQREFEEHYLLLYNNQRYAADKMLQDFSDELLTRALEVTDRLIEDLFTQLTTDIEQEYLFHGA